jgi:flavodoxin
MKALVVYDSNYGNTKKIAGAIAKELETKAVSVSELGRNELNDIELLIVGSPVNGWRPTEKISKFLSSLYKDQLNGVKVAAFDTRVKLFIHGDAAKKISKGLERAGGKNVTTSQEFIVKGTEGPLLDGETDKAINWAKTLKKL